MRVVVLGAVILLAGCVQQGYGPPAPIQLQPFGPAMPYSTVPSDRPPLAMPAPPTAAAPVPLDAPTTPPAADDNGAIPLQDMPTPSAETPQASPANARPPDAAPSPAVQRPPTTGPGSNVPLEGFRPMHSQTRPAP